MKITIVYDNTVYSEGLRSDWGFSSFIELDRRKILFDTGARGSILLSNMEKLGIAPVDIDEVFISHNHHDHTGGLPALLDKNSHVKVWAPPTFQVPSKADQAQTLPSPTELHRGVYSTGELAGIEQSLCLDTDKGILVVVGCSHPRMELILDTASKFGNLYGIVGGLHGTKPQPLEDLDLICATHCTQHKTKIKELYPERYLEGGTGREIEI